MPKAPGIQSSNGLSLPPSHPRNAIESKRKTCQRLGRLSQLDNAMPLRDPNMRIRVSLGKGHQQTTLSKGRTQLAKALWHSPQRAHLQVVLRRDPNPIA